MMKLFTALFNVIKQFASSVSSKKKLETAVVDTVTGNDSVVQPAAPKVAESAADLDSVLRFLSYDIDKKPIEAIKLFQKHQGFEQTGKYGPKTTERLISYSEKIKTLDAITLSAMKQMRKWRLTHYYVAEEPVAAGLVPVYDKQKKVLAQVPAAFFCDMSLQGTGKLRDGRLLNVAGKPYVQVEPAKYESCRVVYNKHVMMMAQKNREPKPAGYFGLSIKNDQVVAVQAFYEVTAANVGVGYGVGKKSFPYTPYRSIATDIGAYGSSDPRFKKSNGVIPPGTRVFILEFVGRKLPDGTIHDGWFTANDTGGGIYGAHIDVFVGTKTIEKNYPMPLSNGVAHIWFEGIEKKIEQNYDYGLYDK